MRARRVSITEAKNRKKKEFRAKGAKHAKDSRIGFLQIVDQAFDVTFEDLPAKVDQQAEF